MFDPFDHEDTDLDEAITKAYSDLTNHSADSDEYRNIVRQLTDLYAIKNQTDQLILQAQQSYAAHQLAQDQSTWQEEQDSRPFYERVDPNTVLTVAGNILIAIVVIKYEQGNVISTKVRDFMRRI